MELLENITETFCVIAIVSILYIKFNGKDASSQPSWVIYLTVLPIVLTVILVAITAIANIWI